MPIKWNYTNINDKYAQCYRLQELLRIEYNNQIITREQHEKKENEVITELLKLRALIKADNTINTNTNDIILTP